MEMFVTVISAARRSTRLLLIGALVALAAGLSVLVPNFSTHVVGTPVMGPAIHAGERVVVRDKGSVDRGSIVVVQAWEDALFTVRVVGLAGDVVTCCGDNNTLSVNGKPVREPYAHGATNAFGDFTVTVPPGRIFVLGDSRDVSVDSRSHIENDGGTLPLDQVRGPAVAVATPAWRARLLASATDVPLLILGIALSAGGLIALIVAGWPSARRLAAVVRRLRVPRRVTERAGTPARDHHVGERR